MVLLWNAIDGNRIPKLSGLKYLRALLEKPEFREPGETFWVMPTAASAQRNLRWLHESGLEVHSDDVHLAPLYGHTILDEDLLERIEERRPKHIVIGIGGGTQERLGLYLKHNLSYRAGNPLYRCRNRFPEWRSGAYPRLGR